jgi:hypothetical protein
MVAESLDQLIPSITDLIRRNLCKTLWVNGKVLPSAFFDDQAPRTGRHNEVVISLLVYVPQINSQQVLLASCPEHPPALNDALLSRQILNEVTGRIESA